MMWQVVETNGTILPDHIWNNTDQSKFNNLVNGDVLFELYVSSCSPHRMRIKFYKGII